MITITTGSIRIPSSLFEEKIPPWERLQIVIKQQQKKDIDAPPLIDQLELIQQLRDDPRIGFFYMIYAVERSSKYFTPYALK